MFKNTASALSPENKVLLYCARIETEKKLTKRERLTKKISINLAMTVREILDPIMEETHRPENMAHFDRLFETFAHGGKDTVKLREGEKLIGTYCLFVPEELIYAAGGRPVRLCSGAYESVEIGETEITGRFNQAGIDSRGEKATVSFTVDYNRELVSKQFLERLTDSGIEPKPSDRSRPRLYPTRL